MLAPGSYKFVIVPILVGIVIFYFQEILGTLVLLIGLYMAWFFRDPLREISINDEEIYAPADGKVIYMEQKAEQIKIGIRMSPFDVHINRSPLSGRVTKTQHKPGKHSSVYFASAEEKNEQNLIILENEKIIAEILQITGLFARRIDCWINSGNEIKQGSKIGMIRFGSQTNLLLKNKQSNKTKLKPQIKVGSKVYAGLTVVAKLEVLKDE